MKKRTTKRLSLSKETLQRLAGQFFATNSVWVGVDTNFADCTETDCGPCPNIDVPQSVGILCV